MQLMPYLKAFRIHSGLTYVFLSLWAVLYSALIAETIDLVKPLLLFILLFYSIRIAFFINNLYDIKEDSVHPNGYKKNPLVALKNLDRYHVLSVILLVTSIFLFLCFLISNILATLAYGILLILDFIYSAPPRLKNIAILDILSHGLFFGSLLALVPLLAYDIPLSLNMLIILCSIFLLSMVMELTNHLKDYEYDKMAKVNTFTAKYGKKITIVMIKVLFLVGFTLLTLPYVHDILLFIPVSVILFLDIILKPKQIGTLTGPLLLISLFLILGFQFFVFFFS